MSLAGSFGLNFATALAVAKLIEPLSTWDYLFVAAVFAAVTPVTFPLSAVALNWGLSQVEKSRRRAILDNPADTARKTIDSLIEDGRRLLDTVPSQFVTPNSAEYHRSRYDHFMRDADAQVSRVAGEWATRCLVVDDRLEAWRGNPVMDGETLREWYASLIKRLGLIRDSLPILSLIHI